MSDLPWDRADLAPLPAPVVADGVASRPGIVYSVVPGFRHLELDLYAPAPAGPGGNGTGGNGTGGAALPVVVWIHGGAFALGSRRLLPPFLAAADFFGTLARAGFVVASIDYRLSGEARWPAPLVDVRAAVRWIRGRAADLGIRPDAVAVWGESAGGHLAAMAGVRCRDELEAEPPGLDLPLVAAVVDWYGPTDFAAMDAQAPPDALMRHDDPTSPESVLLGGPVQEVPDRVADADPSAFVRPGHPPFLIRHGRRDRLVPFGQSELLAAALARSGGAVSLHPVDEADHVFDGHPDPAVFVGEAVEWLREVLGDGRAGGPVMAADPGRVRHDQA